jgi:hypothetical protein
MSFGRLGFAGVAGTVVYFVYGYFVNGVLLRDQYAPFGAVYRSAEEVMRYFPIGVAGTLVAIVLLAIVFVKGYEGSGAVAEGARLGVLVGLIILCTHVVDNYVTLNIGRRLSIELGVAAFVQWVLVCVSIAVVCRPALATTR